MPLHSHEPPHTHPWPSVFFEQTSGLNEPWKTVNIRWSQGGPSKGFESSDRDRHNLLIELKNTDCQPAPAAELPDTDGVKIHDPNMTVVLENAYVRVLSVRIPPGEKEPWHTHTWPAVVVYFSLPASQRLLEGWQENAAAGAEGIAGDLRPQQPAAPLGGKPGHGDLSGVPRGAEADHESRGLKAGALDQGFGASSCSADVYNAGRDDHLMHGVLEFQVHAAA